jgi:hypothetical protein
VLVAVVLAASVAWASMSWYVVDTSRPVTPIAGPFPVRSDCEWMAKYHERSNFGHLYACRMFND